MSEPYPAYRDMALRVFRPPCWAAAVLLAAGLSGCSDSPSVPTPLPIARPTAAPTTTPSPTAPVTAGPAAATLAVSSYEVRLSEASHGLFWYRPHLVLNETSGKSAATLLEVKFKMPNGYTNSLSGPGCFLGRGVVPPGGSWDLGTAYPYCLDLDSGSEISGLEVQVTIVYTDDEGGLGTVTGSTVVTR